MATMSDIKINEKTNINIPVFSLILTIGAIISFTIAGTKKITDIENKNLQIETYFKAEIVKLEKDLHKETSRNDSQDIKIEKNSTSSEEIKAKLQEIQTDQKWIIKLLQEERERLK